MHYFSIETIINAITRLQNINANWLLPAFVFAANDVNREELTDMSKRLGTDQFLDRYFNGSRLNLPPFPSGNNLLRPRLKGIHWDRGQFAYDYIIQQDTKMWGNLFSSRGYREMRQRGEIEGQKSVVRLTNIFQERFENNLGNNFYYEDFLVWLYAFEGFDNNINTWDDLHNNLLKEHLELDEFRPDYRGRFSLSQPQVTWPNLIVDRPTNSEYLENLAPKLYESLNQHHVYSTNKNKNIPELGPDDEVLTEVKEAINKKESFAFLFSGPPGTGKTRYARQVADKLTQSNSDKELFIQFHPAIGYDDFIEGFRPESNESGDGVIYKLDSRLFLRFANKAKYDPNNFYLLIIDELNRGDISRVFGEVLTYVEPDYRGVSFTLPYSGRSESIPENLILIATANPYDRSVTDIDDALLRRFWVVEFEPDYALLSSYLKNNDVNSDVIKRTMRMFNFLNEQLPYGYGHTTFLEVRSIEDLSRLWTGRIRLTLRRAFMHDSEHLKNLESEVENLLQITDDGNDLESDQDSE